VILCFISFEKGYSMSDVNQNETGLAAQVESLVRTESFPKYNVPAEVFRKIKFLGVEAANRILGAAVAKTRSSQEHITGGVSQ
jgi:hypothetical protein